MRLFLKNALFTVLVPGTVAVLVPYGILARGGAEFDLEPLRVILTAPLLALGAATYFWCLWDFAVAGRGTPAPIDPPRQLVARGLYRYVRNPMYVGVLLVIVGWAALFASVALLWYAAGVAVAFHLFVILIEEPMLRRRFGTAYDAYCRAVHRWMPRRRG